MASIVVAGDTSGTVTLAAPAVSGTTTLTLPTTSGTIGLYAAPQVTVYTSGSGTYTVPTGAKYLQVRMVGGGGGGNGGNGGGSGGSGGATTFGALTCNPGNGTSGGTATGGDINIKGGDGQWPNVYVQQGTGPMGANSPFGGAGIGVAFSNAGQAASANTGSGGGGGGGANAANNGGAISGGAAGYLEKLISPLASTYSYAVGAGGTGGTAGAGAGAGGAGGSGVIIITAYFG